MSEMSGTPPKKGTVIPVDVLRDEIKYTVGIDFDEVDVWLKRFNLVNFVSIKGGTGMLEIPDLERIRFYGDYLLPKSREGRDMKFDFDTDTLKSFERIFKLMAR